MLSANQEINLESIGVEALLSLFLQYIFDFFLYPHNCFQSQNGSYPSPNQEVKKLSCSKWPCKLLTHKEIP